MRTHLARLAIASALVAVVLAAFWPVLGAGFLNYDDDLYVTKNENIERGFDSAGLRWAWTSFYALNWHPVTWMSHMLDWRLFHGRPTGHHLTSLLLHAANTLLLFLLLVRTTGATGRSAAVAALFGVHPLHVESVAWVAERKDVLSALFWWLAMLAYVRYARAPGVAKYLLVAALFALGLAAKPMLVTLPFALLLFDVWPLRRWRTSGPRRLILEKLPLFALSAISSAITYAAQRAGGGVASTDQISAGLRAANAVVSYARYLGKTVYPSGLAVFYPHPLSAIPAWQVLLAGLLLAAVTAAAIRLRRNHPYLLVGWLWYLGTLVPVIGLVQVGGQAMADRYTYLPLVGVFIAAAWGTPAFLDRVLPRHSTRLAAIAFGVAILALAAATRVQAGFWRDSRTLFEHAVAVTENNYKAHTSLGSALAAEGKPDAAIAHYRRAIEIRPSYALAHNNLGIALAGQGKDAEAMEHYRRALAADPSLHEAHNNLGNSLARQGKVDEAVAQYAESLRLHPGDALTHFYWGTALFAADRWSEAATRFSEAIRLKPGYGKAHSNLAAALFYQGKYAEAWREIRKARECSFEPPRRLVEILAEKMPEPPGL